jgi:ABC-type phosphate transport system permease subunit
VGWGLAVLAFAMYIVNEFLVDVPAIHYGLFVVMFIGAWMGLRHLR